MLDGKEILIVEDDPIFRNMVVQYLKSLGCHVSEAENGLEGLREMRGAIPDLLLCDLSMPVMTGMEFVEEVSIQYPMVPVIVLSGTEKMSDVAAALRLGVKDFLVKPLSDIRLLEQAIASVLSHADDAVNHEGDFSHHWIEPAGLQDQTSELERHMRELIDNPIAARELLEGLMPESQSTQGDWELRYRALQPADMSPILLDYTWLMDGRLAFYLIDSASAGEAGTGTTLLVRALFNDYLRTQLPTHYDIQTMINQIESAAAQTNYAKPIAALFGIFNACDESLQIAPVGLGANMACRTTTIQLDSGHLLGEQGTKRTPYKGFLSSDSVRITLADIGTANFSVTISRHLSR